MRLEALCEEDAAPPVALPLTRDAGGIWRSDWAPLLPMLLDARRTLALRAAHVPRRAWRRHCASRRSRCASDMRRDARWLGRRRISEPRADRAGAARS